ncbi:RHS repeat-associated core domain-containing protein [Streptomyces sp. B22F1]|uniref:RHS repeat domain-containing protein n=1 Tax=Streptomyces sp. B22F1 TaxID=3153566 RepID=UPI00325F76CF
MHFLVSDHQGTAMLAVSLAAGQAVIRRKQLPFGAPRPTTPTGTAPDFPGTKGFVGGTLDATGLTHIGAREYVPTLGAFISPDPLLDPANPLQANAYTYANNTPVTASDPTGEMLYDEVTKKGFGNNKVRKSWYRIQGYTNSRGNVTNKYRTLVRHNTRSFNSYWRQVRAAEAVRQAEIAAQRKIQEAMRRLERNIQNILGGASLQEQLDQVMSSPEASEALDRQFAKMSESDPCDSSYARASGACGVRGGDGPGTNFVRNGTSGVTFCLALCVGYTYAGDGHGYMSVGALGFGGFGRAAGFATVESANQSWFSLQACASDVHGGCVMGGPVADPDLPAYSADQASGRQWWGGAAYTPGFGVFVGMNFSYMIH